MARTPSKRNGGNGLTGDKGRRDGEVPGRQAADVERDPAATDTMVAPGQERQSQDIRPGRTHEIDRDLE